MEFGSPAEGVDGVPLDSSQNESEQSLKKNYQHNVCLGIFLNGKVVDLSENSICCGRRRRNLVDISAYLYPARPCRVPKLEG